MSVKNTLEFFKIAKPNPNQKDFFLQTAYNFEEWSEVVEAIGMKDTSLFEEVGGAKDALIYLAAGEYSDECDRIYLEKVDRLALADGIADSMVTLIGMAHLANIDIEAQGRYSGVTWSRKGDWIVFTDGNGKIVKPSTYFDPDLEKFI